MPSWNISFTYREFFNLLFRKKICKSCGTKLKRMSNREYKGTGWSGGPMGTYGKIYEYKIWYKCDTCGNVYDLKDLSIESNDAEVYYNRGLDYANMGEYQQAINDYNKAIELDPNLAEAYYNRGFAHKLLAEKAEAIADFEKVITLADDPQLIEMARQQIAELAE